MATVGRLFVQIGADIKGFQAGMAKVEATLKDVGSSVSSVGRSFTAGLTLPIAGAGAMALKTASNYESLRVQLNTLTGSAEEGARAFERLVEFSAGTPFQLQDLVRANNTLLGFGMNSDDAFESLQRLGDISSATGGDLQAIAVAFGQSSAEGKLFTRDIRQLINQGVPAIKLLSESMGVAQSEILNLAEQGEISFDILQESFRKATEEGGIFAGSTERQSQTISGVFSTLKDNVSIALAELGQTIFDTFNLKEVIQQTTSFIGQLVDRFQNLSDETKKRILIIVGVIGAGGPLLIALGGIISILGSVAGAFSLLFSPVTLIIGLFALVAIATQNVIDNFDFMQDQIKVMMNRAQMHVLQGVRVIAQTLLKLGNMASSLPGMFQPALSASTGAIAGFLSTINSGLTRLDSEVSGLGQKTFVSFGESVGNLAGNIKSAMGGAIDFLIKLLPQFKTQLDEVKEGLDDVNESAPGASAGIEDVGKKAEIAGDALQQALTSAIVGVAEALGDTLASAFTGSNTFFESILDLALDFAGQFGRLLVAAGVAALAFKNLLTNPVGAIIAGGALIALSGAVRTLLDKGPSGAGVASQPTTVQESRALPPVAQSIAQVGGSMMPVNIQVDGRTILKTLIDIENRANR